MYAIPNYTHNKIEGPLRPNNQPANPPSYSSNRSISIGLHTYSYFLRGMDSIASSMDFFESTMMRWKLARVLVSVTTALRLVAMAPSVWVDRRCKWEGGETCYIYIKYTSIYPNEFY